MIKFGPSGNSEEFLNSGHKTTLEEPKWLVSYGLEAFEYSFGRGYTMGHETAIKLGEEFKKFNISLSLHAPYFINLANENDEMIMKSYGYIYTGLKFLNWMQADRMTFHIASQGKLERKEAIDLVQKRLDILVENLLDNELIDGKYLCPETMGKQGQIGTYKEIIDFCKTASFLKPTFDFGHINALTQGGLKTEEDYKRIFDYSLETIGQEKTKNCHIHFSKIAYTAKGEKVHLNFDDDVNNFGPDFEPLAKVLIDYKLSPTIISESERHMARDAKHMKEIYNSYKSK